MGIEENAGYQHFLVFQQCFQKPSLSEQGPKNPLIPLSLLGKTWSGQVDYPSLCNCRMSAKWQEDE